MRYCDIVMSPHISVSTRFGHDKDKFSIVRQVQGRKFCNNFNMKVTVFLLAVYVIGSVSSLGMINRISLRPSECNNCGNCLITYLTDPNVTTARDDSSWSAQCQGVRGSTWQ